jgi:1,4-alpha-glucan branching enzyme
VRARPSLLALALVAALAACAAPAAPPPTAAAPGPAATTAPTALAPEDALLATVLAGSAPTPAATAPAATEIPTITLGPAAAAQPLSPGWWDGAVCYEVFVRSFADSDGDGIGDLNGLMDRLDYINDGDPASEGDLGATCIWLMPVAEAASYHGYDTTDYYTIERDYGTNADFRRFVDEAHQRGVRVIVDLVLNHVSSQHPWFTSALADPQSPYRDWFLWSPSDPAYPGPWGQRVWHRAPGQESYYYLILCEGMPDLK